MKHEALRVIRDEHATLAAMLQSLMQMVKRGPDPEGRDQLERDHMAGEVRVRELMHMLMAWEYLGEARRQAFEAEVTRYVDFYLQHMRLEESATT